MAATDLLSRIETEEDEYYTEQSGHYSKHNNKYSSLKQMDESDAKEGHSSKINKTKSKRMNGYQTVDIMAGAHDEELASITHNPFDEVNDNFKETQDPQPYVEIYNHIKLKIKSIDANIDSISRLRDKFNLSDSQQQYHPIMNALDDIMMNNSRITREIKTLLKLEKEKNDKLESAGDHQSSSILQWRVNQLNSCVRRFKSCAFDFEKQLTETQHALKQKEKRKLREFDEEHELNDEKIDYMVEHPDKLELFLQKKFEGMAASDALLERVNELEDRHQGMMKIERSINELHHLWMELNVLVTEQQEHLDKIQDNVEQTKHYMQKATKNLVSAEKKQKASRKLACCAVCLMLVIAIIVVIFVGGFIKFN